MGSAVSKGEVPFIIHVFFSCQDSKSHPNSDWGVNWHCKPMAAFIFFANLRTAGGSSQRELGKGRQEIRYFHFTGPDKAVVWKGGHFSIFYVCFPSFEGKSIKVQSLGPERFIHISVVFTVQNIL